MKKSRLLFAGIFATMLLVSCKDDTKEGLYDEKAIASIDKLTVTIGELESCSYSLITNITHSDASGEAPEHKENDVYMKGNNKMYVFNKSDGHRKAYFYNGSEVAVFRFDEDTYEIVKAPETTMATITAIHDKYGVDFPASDFFYPTLTDDMLHDFDTIVSVGKIKIEGTMCDEINAKNAKMNVFVSIDEATNLPKRLEIYYLGEEKGKSYEITFLDFKSNPVLEDNLFEFTPPANAVKTDLLTLKSDK